MQVGTQRVWDYVGGLCVLCVLPSPTDLVRVIELLIHSLLLFLDNYVHRLVQNKTDGKIVQVEGSGQVSVLPCHVQVT